MKAGVSAGALQRSTLLADRAWPCRSPCSTRCRSPLHARCMPRAPESVCQRVWARAQVQLSAATETWQPAVRGERRAAGGEGPARDGGGHRPGNPAGRRPHRARRGGAHAATCPVVAHKRCVLLWLPSKPIPSFCSCKKPIPSFCSCRSTFLQSSRATTLLLCVLHRPPRAITRRACACRRTPSWAQTAPESRRCQNVW